MPADPIFEEHRRSTRVPLKIDIKVESPESFMCEGETIVVNLHGALISTSKALGVEMRISIHVFLTDKHSGARVVYVNPDIPLHCGIELDQPKNIWGIPLPPNDWDEATAMGRL
jgi:hypothetical protein